MALYPTNTEKETVRSPATKKQDVVSNKGMPHNRGYKRSEKSKFNGEGKDGANSTANESPNQTPSEPSNNSKPAQFQTKAENTNVEPPTEGDKPQTATAFEVGWMFVQQYYTFLNKSPKRLHCFYKAKSEIVMGKECGEIKTYHGQKGAHERVMELKHNNCRVIVSSVDVQASSNGNIIILALGELLNDNEPAQRFVQTFVLCEQERGFFILNDILRFLKDPKRSEVQDVDFVGVVVEDGEFKVVNLSEKDTSQVNGLAPKSGSDVSDVTSLKVEPPTPVGETPVEPNVSNKELAPTASTKSSEPISNQDSILGKPLKTTTTALPMKLKDEASNLRTEGRPTEAGAVKEDKSDFKPVASKSTRSTSLQEIKTNSTLRSSWASLAAGRHNNADSVVANPSPSQGAPHKGAHHSSSTGLRQKSQAPRESYKDHKYSKSICIRGLKEPIHKPSVYEVFSKFGAIKNLGISNHLVFIEYQEPEGFIKALANSNPIIGEEKVLVEARRPKTGYRNSGIRRGNFYRKGSGSRALLNQPSDGGNGSDPCRPRQGTSRPPVAPTSQD